MCKGWRGEKSSENTKTKKRERKWREKEIRMRIDAARIFRHKQKGENWELLQVHSSDELNIVIADIPEHQKREKL